MESYTVFPFNTLSSRESPEAIPAKIRARVAMILVACHLYPRSGTSPAEDVVDKTQACGNLLNRKLHALLGREKRKGRTFLSDQSDVNGHE